MISKASLVVNERRVERKYAVEELVRRSPVREVVRDRRLDQEERRARVQCLPPALELLKVRFERPRIAEDDLVGLRQVMHIDRRDTVAFAFEASLELDEDEVRVDAARDIPVDPFAPTEDIVVRVADERDEDELAHVQHPRRAAI